MRQVAEPREVARGARPGPSHSTGTPRKLACQDFPAQQTNLVKGIIGAGAHIRSVPSPRAGTCTRKKGEVESMSRKLVGIGAVALAIGLAVVPALPAAAFSDSGTHWKACGTAPVPYIQINSTGSGRVNHSLNGGVLNSFNNGSAAQTNWTLTASTSGHWRVFLTGAGGDISYANAVCHS